MKKPRITTTLYEMIIDFEPDDYLLEKPKKKPKKLKKKKNNVIKVDFKNRKRVS